MESARLASAALRSAATDALGQLEGAAFLARVEAVTGDLVAALTAVYGEEQADRLAPRLVEDAFAAIRDRASPLRVLDRRREVTPQWFLREDMVGYACYVDRFAGDLRGMLHRLDHLVDLGVRYLHLMPLLRPREGANDGGYAVADYDEADPRLGDMADLEALAAALHERDISLCLDLVLNHTAQEHEWARKARAGDPAYRDFYLFFPDRGVPDAYEQSLPEVFPDLAPGSFTRLPESGEWVWTTFHEYQWDLNWSNPEVFRAMLAVLLRLGNHGADVVRLDAAPFLWKRMGTDCQNQPEAHRILQALRAVVRIAMPGVILKAEAIVGPDQLVGYLGGPQRVHPECDLAYDNQLMVMLWSAVAARDARLPAQALGRRPPAPPGTGWVTYVRGHDDIGWAVADEDAWGVGWDPKAHRAFLADFFAGRHPGSFAAGADFGCHPVTGDVRTSGMAASLAGLDRALEKGPAAVDLALRRLETLYAVTYSFGGVPLVYMGDELAMRNDAGYADEPGHRDDNRWLHRPRMDRETAANRRDPAVAGRMFAALQQLGEVRSRTRALASDAATTVVPTAGGRVFAYVRSHPRARSVLGLACFSDADEHVEADVLRRAGIARPVHLHSSAGGLAWRDGGLQLAQWSFAWVVDAAS